MLTAGNAATYRAYFRGYQSPMRYWEAPDGRRYWLKFMINRCWPDSVERLRRVDEGATAITDWEPTLRTERGRAVRARGWKHVVADRGCPGRWLSTVQRLPSKACASLTAVTPRVTWVAAARRLPL